MFTRLRLILFTAVAAALAATAGVIAAQSAAPVERGHGLPSAASGGAAALDPTGWATLAEARTSLADISTDTRAQLGLSAVSIADARLAFTFPGTTPHFAGISVYEVRRPGRGSCLFLLDSGGCSANDPAIRAADALPVQLKVADFDGPTGGLPIVAYGQVAPQVASVTITCFGTPYEATVAKGVVTWVAPTAAIGPRDCALEAAVTGGESYRSQL